MTQNLEKFLQNMPRKKFTLRGEGKFYFRFFLIVVKKEVERLVNLLFFSYKPMKILAKTILVVFIFAVVLSSYAYASSNIVRGDSLYGLKRAIENYQIKFADKPMEQVELYTKLAERRLAEAGELAKEVAGISQPVVSLVYPVFAQGDEPATGEAPVVEAVENFVTTVQEVSQNTEQAITAAEQISEPQQAAEALAVINTSQTSQTAELQTIAATIGPVAPEQTVEAVATTLQTTIEQQAQVQVSQEEVQNAIETKAAEVKIEIETSQDVKLQKAEELKPAVEQKIGETKDLVAKFKEDLLAAGVSTSTAEKLLNRVDTKLAKAEAALAGGNPHQAQGLLKATKALMNNAKHFVKQAEKQGEETATSTPSTEESTISPPSAVSAPKKSPPFRPAGSGGKCVEVEVYPGYTTCLMDEPAITEEDILGGEPVDQQAQEKQENQGQGNKPAVPPGQQKKQQ